MLRVIAGTHALDYLRHSGLAEEILSRLKAPAGLDIGARTPEEVALSIFAQMVQLRHAEQAPVAEIAVEIDPVCGMKVDVATARHKAEHEDRTFYFCNPRCREKFLAAPDGFLAA